jgi:homoserine dehydrogenase
MLRSAWRAGFQPGGARLLRFRGVLNATTSLVLSGMALGKTMLEALKDAQDAGIAEAGRRDGVSRVCMCASCVCLLCVCKGKRVRACVGAFDTVGARGSSMW